MGFPFTVDCSAKMLYDEITALLADESRRQAMTKALHEIVKLDSAERICDILEELTKR